MNKSRFRIVAALTSAVLSTAPALAQTAPSSSPTSAPRVTSSQQVGDAVFQKLRPATFRIEQRELNARDTSAPDGIGTGYFISDDGLALTAYHVVFGAPKLSALLVGDKRYPVEVIGFDDYNDIALVKVAVKEKVPFIPIAKKAPAVGDAALAIGNSGGQFLKEKRGTLQRLGVDAGRADFPSGTLELDAPLRPGDSGGPIINAAGEAIGVVSYIRGVGANARGQVQFLSYAIPVMQESKLLADLRAGVKRDAPVLGIGGLGFDIREDAFPKVGLGPKPGVAIASVTQDGPAAKAGLRPLQVVRQPKTSEDYPEFKGDVILEVDGKRILEWNDLVTEVRGKRIGDTIRLTIQRGESVVQVPLTLGSRATIFGNMR